MRNDTPEVILPDDPLAAPVYDEKGNRMRAQCDHAPKMTTTDDPFAQPARQDDGLGTYENRPFG